MNKIIMNGLAMLLLVPVSVFAKQIDDKAVNQQYFQESRQIAKAFMQALGATLKEQLATNGAASAISVCKHVAPALAADYSRDGLIVTRVSLKNRNKTLGEPDAWERSVLEKFDKENAGKNAAGSLEASAVIEDAEGHWFRYMKAIPTQPMCLQCHGSADDIPPEVKALLSKEYPGDRAVGYHVGDIRGAISIKRKW